MNDRGEGVSSPVVHERSGAGERKMSAADLHLVGDDAVDDPMTSRDRQRSILIIGALPIRVRRQIPGTYIVSLETMSWSSPEVTRNTEWPGVWP